MKKLPLLLCLSALLIPVSSPHAQSEALNKTSDIISALSNSEAIDKFYTMREGAPLWLDGRELNNNARALIDVIVNSWENGLNPNVYHYQEIAQILEAGRELDDAAALRAEVLLTDAFVKYVRDLSGMRIKPKDMELDAEHWRQRISVDEALAFLAAHQGGYMDEYLHSFEPQSKAYQLLKDEMRVLAQSGSTDEQDFLKFGGLVKPGQGATDIPKLRARFGLDSPADDSKYTYDKDLVVAVMNFQAEKGLKPDGIIGKRTVDMLNLSKGQKIKRLVANMERLRWIKDEQTRRFIVVNIPASRLIAVDDGQVKVDMPVVVGRKKRETLSFVTMVHGVRFNPTWTVPPTIRKEDILPQLQADPNALLDKGMEVFQTQGEQTITVDPTMVDWVNMTPEMLRSYKFVQSAGDHNPLGRIRVLMPNRHNIYLHDTNHPELFDRSDLAQSSGCVRMKYPERIANFILQDRSGWSDQKMIDVLKTGKTKDYYTDEKLPIYLVYNTVWIGDKDQIIYGNDIYDIDNKLLQLIEKVDGFKIIGHSDDRVAKSVD